MKWLFVSQNKEHNCLVPLVVHIISVCETALMLNFTLKLVAETRSGVRPKLLQARLRGPGQCCWYAAVCSKPMNKPYVGHSRHFRHVVRRPPP